jgi:hypothetical protein
LWICDPIQDKCLLQHAAAFLHSWLRLLLIWCNSFCRCTKMWFMVNVDPCSLVSLSSLPPTSLPSWP